MNVEAKDVSRETRETATGTVALPGISIPGLRRFRTAVAEPAFRGEVWENAEHFRLVGKAYESMPAAQAGYFDIATCRHLAGPLRAWRHPDIRKILVRKAIQTQGSLLIDLLLPYIIQHEPRNTLVLFETDDKALNYCSVRLMDTLHQHPVIGGMIQEVQRENRYDVTTTYIKLPGMTLLIGGLNESNVSTLSWPNVLISEAWIHRDDGLLFKAFGRTTQFENSCKILVESQAAMESDDFARECDLAWRIPLTWECPFCGARQEWDFSQKRPEDFKARRRSHCPDGDLPLQIEPKPGSYAGMIIPSATRISEGVELVLSADERALGAQWECYECGSRFGDEAKLRRHLMDTYRQDIPDEPPRAVLFDWPEEASLGISFAESVRHFLAADAAQKSGNILPKRDWYMQRRARTWETHLTRPQIEMSPGSYDPNQIVPDEHSRDLAVDCQEDAEHKARTGASVTGWFWYIARVVDKAGNSKQLARGHLKSAAELFGTGGVQKRLKIPNDRVVIDFIEWPTQVMNLAIEYRETRPVDNYKPLFAWSPRERVVTWYLLMTENRRTNFKHPDGQIRPWSPPQPVFGNIFEKDGKLRKIPLRKIRFDKMTFQLQLDAIRSGAPGMPRFEVLARKYLDAHTQAIERGNLTYEKQMEAQYYVPEKRLYQELRPDDHYLWCEIALLVRQAMDGLFGHVSAFSPEPAAQTVEH